MKNKCVVSDCDNYILARGLCNRHYCRFKKYGDPLGGGPHIIRASKGLPEEWLSENSGYSGDDCLQYPFARSPNGYGKLRDGSAHRWMCERVNGPASSPEVMVAHSCGNGQLGCVNPRHLRWATSVENAKDRDEHRKTIKGERHYRAILSEKSVIEIFNLRSAGDSAGKVAENFQVSKSAVTGIWYGQNWAWLTGANGGVNLRRAESAV